MNYIFVYDDGKNLKYCFSSVESGEYDGTIKALNAFFACDDTGAELDSGVCEFTVKSATPIYIYQGDILKIISGDRFIGKFSVINISRETENSWRIESVDDIGRTENETLAASFPGDETVSLGNYLSELFEMIGIDITIDTGVNDIKGKAVILGEQTYRELLQTISLSKGVFFSTLKQENLKVSLAPTRQVIKHSYYADDVFEQYEIKNKDSATGRIAVFSDTPNTFSVGEDWDILGFVPLKKRFYISQYDDPVIPVKPQLDGTTKNFYNKFYGTADENSFVWYASATNLTLWGGKTSDYLTVKRTLDNRLLCEIDLEAFEQVASRGEGKYIDADGNVYALVAISVSKGTEYHNKIGYAFPDESKLATKELTLPFADSDTISRINDALSRKKTVEFKTVYTDEDLGEIISVPFVSDKTYCMIKKIDMSLSANKIFATITADMLSESELDDIYEDGAEYGGDTEYGDDTEYGYITTYEKGSGT